MRMFAQNGHRQECLCHQNNSERSIVRTWGAAVLHPYFLLRAKTWRVRAVPLFRMYLLTDHQSVLYPGREIEGD